MTSQTKAIRTQRIFRKQPDFFFVPGAVVLPVLGITATSMVGAIMLGSLDSKNMLSYLLGGGAISGVGIGTYVLVMGKKPHKFQQTLQKAEPYVKVRPEAMVSPIVPQKIPKRLSVGHKELKTIESNTKLHCPVEFQGSGPPVGAMLLRDKGDYKIVFGFRVVPESPFLSTEDYELIGDRIEEGLKDLPIKEFPKFVARNVADCRDRLTELEQLQNRASTQELAFLIEWDIRRVKALTRTLRHNIKTLDFYGTYNLGGAIYVPDDYLEKQIDTIVRMLKIGQNQSTQIDGIQFEQMMHRAFDVGYRAWESFLRDRLGLKFKPYNISELWRIESEEINQGSPPILNHEDLEHGTLPQVLIVRDNQLEWKVNHRTDARSWLFRDGTPDPDHLWVKLPGSKKLLSVSTMELIPGKEWDAGTNKQKFEHAVKALNAVPNSRIVIQLHQVDQEAVQQKLLKISGQSWATVQADSQIGRQNLAGGYNYKETSAAYEDLRRNQHVLDFSWLGIVERPITGKDLKKSLENLAVSTTQFCGKYPEGTVIREEGYVEQYWRESRPLSWRPLMTAPDRQQREKTGIITSILPIVLPSSKDKSGLEFIDPVSKTPLFADLFKTRKHFIITGTTGAGKSVLATCGIFLRDLAEGSNVFIVDNTRADGTGSFSEFTQFNNGNYFDVTKEGHNLFETLDWNSIAGGEDKRQVYEGNLKWALKGLTLGDETDPQIRADGDLILTLCLKEFWSNPEIQNRYQFAHQGGFGTTVWQEMPTLHDFIPYLQVESLPDATPEISALLSRMRLRLMAFIHSPIGKAISKPSSFRSDAKLIVFALANIKDDQEALPVAIMAYSSALLRAMTGCTRLFIDEANTLVKRPAIAELAGTTAAQGRKSNIWLGLAAQSLGAIYDCHASGEILKNVQTYFTGKITADGMKDFIDPRTGKYDKIPEHLLRQAVNSFDMPNAEGCKRWIVSNSGEHWIGDYYPGWASLALTMNNDDEMKLKQHSESITNKYKRWAYLAKQLRQNSNDVAKI
jgi:hypothetical protein